MLVPLDMAIYSESQTDSSSGFTGRAIAFRRWTLSGAGMLLISPYFKEVMGGELHVFFATLLLFENK